MTTLLNSEKEVPKHRNALQEKYNKEKENKPEEKEPLSPDNIQDLVSKLPQPSGWRILVLPFTPKEKTKGGIIIAQESLEKLRTALKEKNISFSSDYTRASYDPPLVPWFLRKNEIHIELDKS